MLKLCSPVKYGDDILQPRLTPSSTNAGEAAPAISPPFQAAHAETGSVNMPLLLSQANASKVAVETSQGTLVRMAVTFFQAPASAPVRNVVGGIANAKAASGSPNPGAESSAAQ